MTISDPPADHNFGRIPSGATYSAQYFSLANSGSAAVMLGQAGIDGQIVTCAALGSAAATRQIMQGLMQCN